MSMTRRPATGFLSLSRRIGVPNTSDLVVPVATAGRTDVGSWGGGIGIRPRRPVGLAAAVVSGSPFRLGSSLASYSTSWSESMISLEVETPPFA